MGTGYSKDDKRRIDESTSNSSLSNLRYVITEKPKWKVFKKKEIVPLPKGVCKGGCPCGNDGPCKQKVTPNGVTIHYPQPKKKKYILRQKRTVTKTTKNYFNTCHVKIPSMNLTMPNMNFKLPDMKLKMPEINLKMTKLNLSMPSLKKISVSGKISDLGEKMTDLGEKISDLGQKIPNTLRKVNFKRKKMPRSLSAEFMFMPFMLNMGNGNKNSSGQQSNPFKPFRP